MADFDDHLRACLPDLWRFAYALSRDRDIADDLVQDCLERALQKRHLHDPSRPMRPWLMTMLRNIFLNQRRRNSPISAASVSEDRYPAESAGPEDRLDLARLIDRLAALPEDQRAPLLFVVVGGLSYAETADALNIPVGTVMSRIARARTALKKDPARTVLRSVQ